MEEKKILIADDSELNRAILVDMLPNNFTVVEVANGREAVAEMALRRDEFSMLLLDVVMPEMDGFEVLEEMNRRHWIEKLPVIMISAESSTAFIERAFQMGATDYINRPFIPEVIRRRILNVVLLQTRKQHLLDMMTAQLYQKEKNTEMVVSILSHVVEFRSGEAGDHMSHVAHITALLLKTLMGKTDQYHLDEEDVEAIETAAELHDIGKLLIPEEILTKPGALTSEEFEIVKRHTVFGSRLITSLPFYQNERLVQYAIEICHYHHERWKGEGYPDGLKGDAIPIAAQVVSLADVYDALVSKRCYKEAFSHEESMRMIHAGESGTFNPLLLECLDEIADHLKKEVAGSTAVDSGKYHLAAKTMMEDLYRGRGDSAARVAMQLGRRGVSSGSSSVT